MANRRAWDEELPRELERAQRSGEPLAVAILDLDHFKSFNDSLGHQAGDQLLKEAAAAWRDLIRAPDFIARYGGEEFAVLLPRCPAGATRAIVERLRSSTPSDQTTSAGAACWDGSESPDELVGRADSALYEAKRAGRDRSVVADVGEIILDRRGP
ncbi:MAG: GGDEF domain-containing protein [Actinobacteria bacterium]|nr:GGDEF domain-containing protein [Actinomycetota bacterium]